MSARLHCYEVAHSVVIAKRQVQTCATTTSFKPLSDNYNTLRHVHFPGITAFARGQAVQDRIVAANLDFKRLETKIRRQQKEVAASKHTLSEYESQLLANILAMKPMPTLLTFEFENVYTGGKQMKQDPELGIKIEHYRQLGCQYHQLERGGQVTWHGRGQLVAYLVADLKQFSGLTVRCLVDSVLLSAVRQTLDRRYGLSSYVNENPGVWMAPHDLKISSVGCNIQHGISSYGVALNVDPDLHFLNTYTMCGLPGTRATSIREQGGDVDGGVKEAAFQYAKQVARRLNVTTVEHMSGEDLDLGDGEQA
ncbi:Octanoyltransferase [[Candida] zeylanoides]